MIARRVLLALLAGPALLACAADEPGGTTGSAGTTGSGGTPVMNAPSTYPHNTPGAAFPFPQGHPSSYCTLAVYNTDKVALAYTNWKSKFYDAAAGRIVRPEDSNDTVSEGIAYGMLIGVYMNDQPMFDKLWAYAKAHFDGNGLMNWHINASGAVIGQGSATDSDEDMAWALIMAGKQWNAATYTNDAKTLINNMRSHELEGTVLKPGDNFGGAAQTNPSYFAPSYYRAFARVTGDATWMSVLDQTYTILSAASGANGLVPNWVNSSGAGVSAPGSDQNGPYYGYDACRTPWRIAMDYCQTGEPRAKAYLDKVVGFFVARAPAAISQLKDGYTTAGGDPPTTLGDYSAGMPLYGPAGTGAMAGGAQVDFVRRAHIALVNQTTGSAMNVSGTFNYYSASWGVLSLLAMSGNFWDMAN